MIGRRDRKVDGGGGFSGTMGEALDRFENGIMMVSAIRHDGACAERFACRLGEIAKESLDLGGAEWAALMHALDIGVGGGGAGGGGAGGSAYANMTRSFERVARGMDDLGACQRECNRCIAL